MNSLITTLSTSVNLVEGRLGLDTVDAEAYRDAMEMLRAQRVVREHTVEVMDQMAEVLGAKPQSPLRAKVRR